MRSGDIDSWTVDQDGITYRVDLFTDDNQDVAGSGDCCNAQDIAAHARGDWLFTGVVVTPLVDGRPVTDAQDSLWGVEYGRNPGRWQDRNGRDQVIDRDYLTRVHPVPDMIAVARGNLAGLRDSLVSDAESRAAELRTLKLDDCPAYNPRETRGRNVANAHCLRALGHDMPHRDLDGREWS